MPEENRFIWLKTTRYSTVIRAFVERYPDAVVKLNRQLESRSPDEWCTKKILAGLIDFSLSANDNDILSFHDNSREMYVSIDQLPFVKELAAKKMVRYEISKVQKRKPGWLARIFGIKA